MARLSRTALLALPLVLVGAASGCRCNRDHPYVPYSINEAGGSAGDDAVAPPPPPLAEAGAFQPHDSAAAPPGATRLTVDGLDVAAPPEQAFALALSGDFDGDGLRDAAALVLPIATLEPPQDPAAPGAAGNPVIDRGVVLLYRGRADGALDAPVVIATPPPLDAEVSIPDGAVCTAKRRLAQVGRHTLFVETGSTCDGAAASRWVAAVVVGARGDATLHFRATLLDPVGAPALSLDVDGADRDGDGLDDVTLRASLEGGGPPFEPGPRVSVSARWFDRPAGMSRDSDEPEASFKALGSSLLARAGKAKDAPNVPPIAEQGRALARALCVEGGAPRVVDLLAGSRALSCGTSKGLEELGLAEARAYATMGDPLRAIAAFDRAQIPPAARTPARTTDAQGWIGQSAPIVSAPTTLRAVSALPQIDRGASPSWAALAFDAAGKLLVRTGTGVSRVDPVQGDEAAAPDVAPWPSSVVSPDGAFRWIEAYDACDGRALHATFAPTAQGDPRDVLLPIAPPLGTRCAASGSRGVPSAALPISWGPRGLEALVAGEPVLVSPDFARATPLALPFDQAVTLGAPRSPGGRAFVAPTSMGLFVRGARPRLLRAKELEGGWLELRDCAVSDDASRVACVRGGVAFVGVWPPE